MNMRYWGATKAKRARVSGQSCRELCCQARERQGRAWALRMGSGEGLAEWGPRLPREGAPGCWQLRCSEDAARTWGSALCKVLPRGHWGLQRATEGLLWECGDRWKAEQAAHARWRGGGDSEPPLLPPGPCVCPPRETASGGWGQPVRESGDALGPGPALRVSGGRSTMSAPEQVWPFIE